MSRIAHRGRIAHILRNPGAAGDKRAIAHFADGGLLVENGRIKACDDWQKLNPDPGQWQIIQHKNALILPGFVDSHVHFPQTDIIGGYGSNLLGWLQKYAFPVEQKIGEDVEYARDTANFFVDELLKNGTTSALVFGTVHKHSIDALFTAALARNMRLLAGKVLMDQGAPADLCETRAAGRADTLELIKAWHQKGRLGYAITPRFALTSSPQQLQDAGQMLAAHPDVLMHTHLSENPDEVAAVKRAFPDCADYLAVYQAAGLLGPRSVFAHCLHLSASEKQRLADAGASIAFCPTSNLFLGSGLFDLRTCQHAGINVGLGTDIGAGTSFSMLTTQAEAYKVGQLRGTSLHPFEALYLATLGGAKALHIEQYVGNFAVGKEADFVVLDTKATALLSRRLQGDSPIHDMLFAFCVLGDERAVRQTWVAGVQS
ncbi:Guanine deaminase [hydrothermal vent metagenome]|uniref:guanine deaminase n=1 Tax=hydrothermal vent metagenome TaxID=652676 RepID=A0A3B0SYJ5_9ZZZZ